MDTGTIVVLAIIAIALVVGVWLVTSRRKTEVLKDRYGAEYDRLARAETPRRAVKEIERREKRVEALHIRPLTDGERSRYSSEWQRVQTRFVDDPAGAVIEADALVASLMTARGYPVADFEQRAADISVDHPLVVEHYREAHDIALRHERREASTEDLRQALVHYRALFSELLEDRVPAEAHR